MPLKFMPLRTKVHCIEMLPSAGAKICRSAGSSAELISVDGDDASLKMPKWGCIVKSNCEATIGSVGNGNHQKATIGKAGRNRWKGRRPRVRGVAMNPVDHPMGGGEGRTSGGGHPISLRTTIKRISNPKRNLNHQILRLLRAVMVAE